MFIRKIAFEIEGMHLVVYEHTVERQQVYRVVFPDDREQLVLTRAIDGEGRCFWTALPEGRRDEVELLAPVFGDLIAN